MTIPPPGSPDAKAAGCTCPVMDNSVGLGYMGQPDMFVVSGSCRVHGTVRDHGPQKSPASVAMINTQASQAFRELREIWFYQCSRSQLPERAWESDVDETLREEFNRALKVHFDDDTEAILRGENRPIAPTCAADLD